ncbi:MAG: InlB B-repeat-containing protein [Slackia sp.]
MDIATQADGTVVFPENPTRDGYEFAGWTYDSAGTDPYVDGTKLDKHVNLYAQWNKVETPVQEDVTYTFEDVDGTVLGSVTYTYEQIIAGVYNWGVVAPEKAGYEFVGWCVEGTDYTVDPSVVAAPQNDTTFVAKWNKVETPVQEDVTYTFVDEDGTVLGDVTYTYEQVLAGVYNWNVVTPADKPGYEFVGWCVEGTDYTVDPSVVAAPQNDTTFVAKWNKVETPVQEDVTYTFVDEDGTVLGDVTYTYEQVLAGVYNWNVVTPADKPGYEFVGWCVEGTDYTVDPSVVAAPQNDTTFVAKWNKVETPVQEDVTYTFVDEDGTVLGDVTYTYEQVLAGVYNWNVVTPADKPGYEFVGWCVEGTDYTVDPSVVAAPQNDTTFVAKWNKVETPVQEDVTYTFVEEDWTVLGSVTYTYDQVLNGVFDWDVVKPAKEGYKFLGWCYEGTDYVVDPSTVAGPQHNATFVAKWEKIGDPVEQNVTFTFYDEDQTTVLGDVTYTMSQIEAGVYNWNVITPAPRDGYVFEGWSFMGSEGIIDFNVTRAPSTDQSLVAHWKAVDPETVTHKVTFSDGIEATEDAVIEVEDGKAVARPGDPELAGYKFLGWTLDKETMELYDFDTPVTADITLHGVWQKVTAETPGADENQAQGENGKTEGSETESAKAGKAELTTLPQTSDNSMMLVGAAAAAGVAALGAGAYALRRRNEQR